MWVSDIVRGFESASWMCVTEKNVIHDALDADYGR